MKYLLVIAVVLVAFWVWRNNRLGDRDASRPPTPPRAPQSPAIMVACAHCGMHLPSVEAVQGQHGVYCCHEHRRLSEDAGA
ncbi:MAG: hypothetical protein MUF44_08550 [Hydrogenophaga sp.]|jgi:uncharacterized protein|nr:hypothetical protein [Hydrogenophaga sp.]